MSNTLVCPKCSGTKYYSVFDYDDRKKAIEKLIKAYKKKFDWQGQPITKKKKKRNR